MSDDLRRDLDELRSEIERVQSGKGDRHELAKLMHAVELKLDAPDDEDHHEHLNERLNEAVTNFESSHPDLARVIRRALDTLSASGI